MKLASCPSSCGDGSLRLMRLLRNKKFRASACKDSIESDRPSVELGTGTSSVAKLDPPKGLKGPNALPYKKLNKLKSFSSLSVPLEHK